MTNRLKIPRSMCICAILACGILAGCASRGSAKPADSETYPFNHGMVLGLYSNDADRSYLEDLDEIVALGCDSVSISIVFFMDDYDSSFLYSKTGRTAPEFRIRETLDAARERGLRIMLFPYMLLDNPSEGKWRGAIEPKDLFAWWRSYRAHILFYANLAEEYGVEVFCVGSELSSMEKHDELWRELISEVRRNYGGLLTYTANWDHREVSFWDAVDLLSMSSYFELAKTTEPTLEDIVTGWKPHYDSIKEWYGRVANGRPLIMAEVGYASQDGCARYPWDYTKNNPVDLEEQRLCYEAFREVWEDAPFIGGIFFYAWFEEGGPEDTHYTPKGKPALKIVQDWFGGAKSANAVN